jgi:hypothetical protein
MTRRLCGLLSVLTLAAINAHASAPVDPQRHRDFSGTYTLLLDRSVAVSQPVPGSITPPDTTSGRTVVGSCGTQFVITQTATQVTIRVVSGVTAARRYHFPAVDGTYELDHSTTMSSIGHSKQVASLSWRGAALDLVLTRYSGETRVGRVEYVFRFDRNDTLTVAYLTGFSAHEIANNDSYLSITSVYQRSVL